MGQRRTDREWSAPRNPRHVWVLGEDRLKPPTQGLIGWRRRSRRWSALVVMVDESVVEGRMIQYWLRIERLRRERSDPNRVLRYFRFTELLRPRGTALILTRWNYSWRSPTEVGVEPHTAPMLRIRHRWPGRSNPVPESDYGCADLLLR